MIKNSKNRVPATFPPHRTSRQRLLVMCLFLISVLLFAGCGGHKKDPANGNSQPTNIGGGYTLMASGGTLNDGSGVNGLVILATLRDSQGWGPVLPWTITISGPGSLTNSPLTVEYSDPRLGSYMSWEWSAFGPSAGSYRVTATNGTTTIYYDFNLTTTVLSRPAPNASYTGNDMTVTWPAVTGAGSYAYDVCSPNAVCINGVTTTLSAIASFATLSAGDYLVRVTAYATDRKALNADHTAAPSLASQEKVSEYSFTYPVGNTVDPVNYEFKAAGGILDYGFSGPGGAIYGLAIWTSLQDITSPGNPAAPAGDWNIIITDPHGLVMNYIYPASNRHYAYWYYGIEPVAGTYSVTATYGAASKTSTFTLSNTTPALAPLSYSQISSSLVSNATNTSVNDINITWPAVTNAKSYYLSLWADVWNTASKQYKYQEVWSNWVNTTAARVLNGSVTSGLQCDVYVTAYAVDMTSAAPPATPPTRADMSENYYGYSLTFVTP